MFTGFMAYDTHVAIAEYKEGHPDHLKVTVDLFINFISILRRIMIIMRGSDEWSIITYTIIQVFNYIIIIFFYLFLNIYILYNIHNFFELKLDLLLRTILVLIYNGTP